MSAKKELARPWQYPAGDYTTAAGTAYTAETASLTVQRIPLCVLMMTPKEPPVGIVQLLHGMCEYKDRYVPFMETLVDNGFACIIHDHRGHGGSVLSDDDYGYMYELGGQCLVEDAHQITLYARNKWGALPLVLFGHSMGSLVARAYLRTYDHEPSAVILSGPPCANRAAAFARALTGLLIRFRGGHCRSRLIGELSVDRYADAFPKEHPCAWVCSDAEALEKYITNPLCQFKFTLNGYYNLFDLLDKTYSKEGWALSNPALPILFAAGADDPCAGSLQDFKNTVMFLWKQGYYCVAWKRYPGMRHEILNETNRSQVMQDMIRFLKNSLPV